MYDIPEYFKNSYAYVLETMKKLTKARVSHGCQSAGNRAVEVAEYGTPNLYTRTANFSSAIGAGDITCYAKKHTPVS